MCGDRKGLVAACDAHVFFSQAPVASTLGPRARQRIARGV
jgi:hypothetical protein